MIKRLNPEYRTKQNVFFSQLKLIPDEIPGRITSVTETYPQMKYPVDKSPNVALAFLLGFQQYLIMFGPTFAIPVILSPTLCIASESQAVVIHLN